MKRTLLLNNDWSPLHFISDKRAIRLFLKQVADVVSTEDGKPSLWDETFRTSSEEYAIPATLHLTTRMVHKKFKIPRFRKRVLFARDNWSCQYCRKKLDWSTVSIDHVMPVSRGGKTTWKNCVTACKPCNRDKANQTPEEAKMKLVTQPNIPSSLHFWDAAKSSAWHKDWDFFVSSMHHPA